MSAASRIVRASKFRHVFAEPEKPDNCYSDLELSPNTGDHNYIKGNSKFFSVAVRGGGGPVLVLPYSQVGKLPRGYPLVNGHSAAVYDMAWCPSNDNILATGSDDCTAKIWSIPDGGLTETIKEPLQTLTGHGKPVSLLSWHPTASNVLATVGKEPSVRIWDVEKASAVLKLEAFGGLVQDFSFNHNGGLLGTSDKAKMMKVHDPRSGTVSAEWQPHAGGKPFRFTWLGASGGLVTVGFTAQSKREVKVWDPRGDVSKPLAALELDQMSGVIMPFYDEDTRMLYLVGKGDGNIRYFEMVDGDPYVYPLAEHRTNVSTKGADFLPKRSCNAMKCEVARFLKLTNDSVEPISFIVPRKETSFQEDIYPETYSGVPSMTAEEYFSGKSVATAKKMSMDPSKRAGYVAPVATFHAAPAPAHADVSSPKASAGSSSNNNSVDHEALASAQEALAAALSRATKAEARVVALTSEVDRLQNKVNEATEAVATAQAAAAAAAASSGGATTGGGDDGAEAAALKKQLAEASERIAALEASEAKLKKAVAALSA